DISGITLDILDSLKSYIISKFARTPLHNITRELMLCSVALPFYPFCFLICAIEIHESYSYGVGKPYFVIFFAFGFYMLKTQFASLNLDEMKIKFTNLCYFLSNLGSP
ncbi:hypothetical protein ACJX0J_011458, partial [Zea mays]